MRYRHRVLILLFALSMITFLDRVCLSVAGPRMQQELSIGPGIWGWVVGIFALAYGIFQIPVGILGDRIGARKVLFAIVLWWSACTWLTGSVASIPLLLGVRFLFGAGEGGAYPNSSSAIARWFPISERGRALGFIWMASRLGGAVTPFLIIPLQAHYGWRLGFHLLGLLGMTWAAVWFLWFRDWPMEKKNISQEELETIGQGHVKIRYTPIPWRQAFRSWNFWAILLVYHTLGYGGYFYLSWLNTYLVKGRGFQEKDIIFLSSLPFIFGAIANVLGGYTSDFLVRRIGLKWSRRAIGGLGMAFSAVFMLAAALSRNRIAAVVFLALGAGASDFLLPTCWATCLDIGKKHAGAISASMNAAGQISSFLSGVLFGYAVLAWKSYDSPIIPIAGILFLGALLWLTIDATKELVPESDISSMTSADAKQ
jgi:MFS transporter, ACS family, glucarate transporter